MNPDDDLLGNLPSHDLDPDLAERIRSRAHRILRERARRESHPIAFWLSTGYRVVEPVALIALGLGYVAWTVHETVALLH